MMRIYEDGTVEQIRLVWAVLEQQHSSYKAFPYDEQHLDILVESHSHGTQRITLSTLLELTGVDPALTGDWPGFDYNGFHEDAMEVYPAYQHYAPCRAEKKSQVKFRIHVHRSASVFLANSLFPAMVLTMTSWAAVFIKLSSLMPRVAVGFISFLTLTRWSTGQRAALPVVNYAVWLEVFMAACRFGVLLSLAETVAAQYLIDKVSTRTALAVDAAARVVLPLDFFVVIAVLFAVTDGEAVAWLQAFVFANVGFMVLFGYLFTTYSYMAMCRGIRHDALKLYGSGDLPFDRYEVHVLFTHVDDDGGGTMTGAELVQLVRHGWGEERDGALAGDELELAASIEKKVGSNHITIESFRDHQREIFVALRRFKLIRDEKRKAGAGAAEAPPDPEGSMQI